MAQEGGRKRRLELLADRRCIRCQRGNSVGRGVIPDILPVVTKLAYLIRGANLKADKSITKEGSPFFQRLHIHFYECDRRGVALGGHAGRIGGEVGLVALSTHCVGDGIVPHQSPSGMILAEGIGGILGPKCIRFIGQKRPRDHYGRLNGLWGRSNPVWAGGEKKKAVGGASVFAANVASETSVGDRANQGDVATRMGPNPTFELNAPEGLKDEVATAMEPTPTCESDVTDGLGPFSDKAEEEAEPTSSWANGDFPTEDSPKAEIHHANVAPESGSTLL